jgi:hypothetical protein
MKTILHLAFAILTCASAFAAEMETAAAQAQRIEIPRVDFRETTLRETCEFLSQKSVQLNGKRVNIVIAAEARGRITLRLVKQPLLEVLREAAGLVGCEVQLEPYALVIREKGAPKLPTVLVPKDANVDAIRKKLDRIILPVVDMRDTTAREAVEFLVQKSKQLDPDGEGVGVVAEFDNQGAGGAVPAAPPAVEGIPGLPGPAANAAPDAVRPTERRITLRCDEMPLLEVYRYVTALAGLEMEADKYYRLNIHPPKTKPNAR